MEDPSPDCLPGWKNKFLFNLILLSWPLLCTAQDQDFNHACAHVTPDHQSFDMGVITSSLSYPQPENSEGCRMWYIQGNPGEHIMISFDDLDLVTSDPDKCTGAQIILGPDPNTTLCGSLRYMNLTRRTYRSRREHMWIKYLHKHNQVGRGFKLTYIIDPTFSKYCPDEYFTCDNGACILQKWHCNGAYECLDQSDEITCSGVRPDTSTFVPFDCGSGFIRCEDVAHQETRCFSESILCDGKQDCFDGRDEKHCDNQCRYYMEGPKGIISSPGYPDNYPNNQDCRWIIHVNSGSRVQLRFMDFSINQSDYVEIRNTSYDGTVIGRFDWKNPPTKLVESYSNSVAVLFHSDHSGTAVGFNATFQEKGVCLDGQESCGYGENDCYDSSERCDGSWNCPLQGGDERGCGHCGEDRFSCGAGTKCYLWSDHCNGIVHCSNKNDERGCSPQVCGSHNGTFLCHNQMCIYESWHCDGANDCGDNSDEINCPLSRKVVIAAVIGSLICALLLTIALGCTCQLHALRLREQHNRQRYRSPLTQLQEELFAHRMAPPNYSDAMVSSRPYEEARAEFLEQMQAAVATNTEVDIQGLVTRIMAPSTDSNHNEPQVTTPVVSDVLSVRPPRAIVLPTRISHSVIRPERHSSGGSTSSDDTMIDLSTEPNNANENSNVLVNISTDNGSTAQWRRSDPKDDSNMTPQGAAEGLGSTVTQADNNASMELVTGAHSEDSDSEILNLSGTSDTSSDLLSVESSNEKVSDQKSEAVSGCRESSTVLVEPEARLGQNQDSTSQAHSDIETDNVTSASLLSDEAPIVNVINPAIAKVPQSEISEPIRISSAHNAETSKCDDKEPVSQCTDAMESAVSMTNLSTNDTQPLID